MIRNIYKLWCRFRRVDAKPGSFWMAEYLTAYRELVKANKGLRRMRARLDRMKDGQERLLSRLRLFEVAATDPAARGALQGMLPRSARRHIEVETTQGVE